MLQKYKKFSNTETNNSSKVLLLTQVDRLMMKNAIKKLILFKKNH
jgi:hypothetical protein